MDASTITGVTKTFRLGVGRARVREMSPWPLDRALARALPRWWSRDTFDALRDVSLPVAAGTSVGIVGHNGAGKTTLLKVIAGITEPTRGEVRASGRVGALIDVLVGFHPDLTGRENIYLLGAVHGFGRRAMLSRVGRIFDFAEIDELSDTPVKRYSAGMIARLGFAVITALDLEILLVDEVLAVGDAAFQRKCIAWLQGYRSRGGTLLFVSHNLALVRSMTQRVVWLDHGRVAGDGPPAEVLAEYARAMEHREPGVQGRQRRDAVRVMRSRGMYRWGAGGAWVERVRLDEPPASGFAVDLAISYEAPDLQEGVFCVGFVDEGGRDVGVASSPLLPLRNRKGTVRCSIRPLPLRSGIYFPVVAILSPDGVVRDRWRLDRFEGADYRRILVPLHRGGRVVEVANLYELRGAADLSIGGPRSGPAGVVRGVRGSAGEGIREKEFI